MFNYKSYHISLPSKRMAYNNFFWETIYANYFKYIFLTLNVPNWSSKTCSQKIFFLVLICWHHGLPWNSKNIKPRGLYFSKVIFEGLIIGAVKLGGAYAEGNVRPKIDWTGKLCQLGFTDTRREDVGLSKTQASKLKTQPQITSLKTQYSVQR